MSAGGSPASFVIGQWVRGARFFGRAAEIADLLSDPHGRWAWIAGLRRIGKTSLLKQLDHLAGAGAGCLPLFWDLQGVGGAEELALTFTDALLDAEEALARLGIAPAEVEDIEDADVFAALAKLAPVLAIRSARLFVLCDEADELLTLERNVPGLAARLWEALGGFGSARVVLASSLRLCDSRDLPRPDLERFAAPRYLGMMTDDEARSLLRQEPAFDARAIETLRAGCGNHPMLLQLAAKRCQELGDAEAALRQVAADRSVAHLLAVDFDLLAGEEQRLLRALAAGGAVDGGEPAAERLLRLGLLLRGAGGGLGIRNRFLASWLRES
jgi:hypothetical protein